MSQTILFAIIALCILGVTAAVILYYIAQKFKVIEDPNIDIVNDMLPGANCGGCGFAGCRALAEAIVKSKDLSVQKCPVGGNDVMKQISEFLGLNSVETEPQIAVVRCQGSKINAPSRIKYEGAESCAFAHYLSAGESGCQYGCLGEGDCVRACLFDAIIIDESTGLPIVFDEKCVACGACVKACPRAIIELRPKGKKDRRIYVSCISKDKGAIARKSCNTACIGCGKCVKECAFGAITLENNLAYIDPLKCTLCRKCVAVCPTSAIIELNFPARKQKTDTEELSEPVKTA